MPTNLLKTSKWRPHILFNNIISPFWLPCLLILSKRLLTSIMNVTQSLALQAKRSISEPMEEKKIFEGINCY